MPTNTKQTLLQLQNGELAGCSHLKLAEGLTSLPSAIFTLADSLEVLDLANNQLTDLPDEFALLKQLKILFLSFNQFQHIPDVLAKCPKLEMIAFKGNQITTVSEHCLPRCTRWLILTDNQISRLPNRIGELSQLKKLALAGNQLTELPTSLSQCHELELIRLSANQLTELPECVLSLPKLAWLAFSGNPFSHSNGVSNHALPTWLLQDITLLELIGEGASGRIYRATHNQQPDTPIAVKLFKGSVTSDGYPIDELDCCLQAGQQQNLIPTLAQIQEDEQLGLVMQLIGTDYRNLGLPPSLQSCTRDTFAKDVQLDTAQVTQLSVQMAQTLLHLHQQQVSHGDIYAHNTLFNAHMQIMVGDFGAASNLSNLSAQQRQQMKQIETRALGLFIDDLLQIQTTSNAELLHQLQSIRSLCMNPPAQRIELADAVNQLHQLSAI